MAVNTTNHDGWYTIVCGEHSHILPVRYQDPVAIGKGAFGAVM
jgi:hypothetical protein